VGSVSQEAGLLGIRVEQGQPARLASGQSSDRELSRKSKSPTSRKGREKWGTPFGYVLVDLQMENVGDLKVHAIDQD
jgi:hypothetical protein